MLVFNRPGFKSGVMIIDDRNAEGDIVKKMLKAKDNGTEIEFEDEAFIQAKYPEWAVSAADDKKNKANRKKNKQDRKATRA